MSFRPPLLTGAFPLIPPPPTKAPPPPPPPMGPPPPSLSTSSSLRLPSSKGPSAFQRPAKKQRLFSPLLEAFHKESAALDAAPEAKSDQRPSPPAEPPSFSPPSDVGAQAATAAALGAFSHDLQNRKRPFCFLHICAGQFKAFPSFSSLSTQQPVSSALSASSAAASCREPSRPHPASSSPPAMSSNRRRRRLILILKFPSSLPPLFPLPLPPFGRGEPFLAPQPGTLLRLPASPSSSTPAASPSATSRATTTAAAAAAAATVAPSASGEWRFKVDPAAALLLPVQEAVHPLLLLLLLWQDSTADAATDRGISIAGNIHCNKVKY